MRGQRQRGSQNEKKTIKNIEYTLSLKQTFIESLEGQLSCCSNTNIESMFKHKEFIQKRSAIVTNYFMMRVSVKSL